jgi:pimeloyl-ACP methyl ester carboxylesterase
MPSGPTRWWRRTISDEVVPAERGRYLAAGIAGARYVSLPSANHLILEEEPAWQIFLDELALFLDWERTRRPT